MKTKYFIWKDPSCEGVHPDWLEISGQEFNALVTSEEGKDRHFIRVQSASADKKDGILVMEATKPEYLEWRKEYDHRRYLRNCNKDMSVCSYDALLTDDGNSESEISFLADDTVNIEGDHIRRSEPELLRQALLYLKHSERMLIQALYLGNERVTEKEYAEEKDVTQQAINKQKSRILRKLRKILEE